MTKRPDRLHSKNPVDAAWRRQQAQVDSDIEGLHRDEGIARFMGRMRAEGVDYRERIIRLKAYIRFRQKQGR